MLELDHDTFQQLHQIFVVINKNRIRNIWPINSYFIFLKIYAGIIILHSSGLFLILHCAGLILKLQF